MANPSTIGTGGDYSTPASWEADAPATLTAIWLGQVLNQEITISATTIAGSVSTSSLYKHLTANTGASFVDVGSTRALAYNGSDGAALTMSDGYSNAIILSESFARMSKLQVKTTSGSSRCTVQEASDTQITQCLFDGSASTSGVCRITTSSGQLMTNCLVINRASAAESIMFVGSAAPVITNCTFICPTGVTGPTNGLAYSYAAGTEFKNCAIYTNGTNVGSSSFTYTNCYSDDNTSLPTGVTNAAYDTGSGSGFESTTADWRIKSTSAFNGAGTGTGAPAADIYGTTRDSPPDVGCFEFVAAADSLMGQCWT